MLAAKEVLLFQPCYATFGVVPSCLCDSLWGLFCLGCWIKKIKIYLHTVKRRLIIESD